MAYCWAPLCNFLILIPGLVKYQFKWSPKINLRDSYVHKILVMLVPRVGGMLLYQLTFIARDNIASRLPLGSVSALTYGWMILQVPETLIGTAIGTALLPTLSEHFAKGEVEQFRQMITRIKQVMIALAVPSAILLAAVLGPFLDFAFGFDAESTQLLLWVSRAFLAGLLSHVLLELGARIFFARQNAVFPLIGSAINLVVYILFGALLANPMGATGIALADAAAFTAQAAFLFLTFGLVTLKEKGIQRNIKHLWQVTAGQPDTKATFLRALLGSLIGGLVILLMLNTLTATLPSLVVGLLASLIGMAVALFFVRKELKILVSM